MGSRCIALLFLQPRRYMGWVVNATPRKYSYTLSLTSALEGRVVDATPRKYSYTLSLTSALEGRVVDATSRKYSYTLSLTSELDGAGGRRHAPAALPPGKTRYPLYRRLGGPRAGLDRCGKSRHPTGIRFPDRPARSQSLYRLSYPGPHCTTVQVKFIVLGLHVEKYQYVAYCTYRPEFLCAFYSIRYKCGCGPLA